MINRHKIVLNIILVTLTTAFAVGCVSAPTATALPTSAPIATMAPTKAPTATSSAAIPGTRRRACERPWPVERP